MNETQIAAASTAPTANAPTVTDPTMIYALSSELIN